MTTDELKSIHEQVRLLRASAMKLDREPFWLPVVYAAGLITVVASLTALALSYV